MRPFSPSGSSRGAARRHRLMFALTAVATVVLGVLAPEMADATGSGAVTGTLWKDLNRNGVIDSGEVPVPSVVVYLYDAGGNYVGGATTDGAGRYSFGSLAAGAYEVMVDPAGWESWQQDWVPTTTGGDLFPRLTVSVADSVVNAPLGIRPITRSTTIGSPVTAVTAASGLRVESYDDAVTAQQLYEDLSSGSLVGGSESADVTIRFDVSSSSSTTTGVGQSNGQYTSYDAVSYVTYSSWLTGGDATLFHEYGHAWSLYYAYLVQQDPTLSGYLTARGLSGDYRVGSSYEWSPREMIAEDYRQLFGTTNAKAQSQMNTAIPPASQVPGLADYLSGAFRTAPSSTSSSSTNSSGSTSTTPSFDVATPTVSPTPVSKSATISTSMSLPANVTIQVLDGSGNVVRTLLSSAQPAGTVSAPWDRKNSAGSRVKSGTYVAVATATDQYSRTVTQRTTFKVS